MVRVYGAFLLRYWQLADERRLEITHVQSGERLLTSSPDAMLAWAQAQLDAAGGAAPAGAGEGEAAGANRSDPALRPSVREERPMGR